MILSKKMFMSFMLVAFGFSAQAMDSRDAFGRTVLMNYIDGQEKMKTIIDNDIDRLWHVCYETTRTFDGVYQDPATGRITNRYKYETRRRMSCTDQDIHNLELRKNDRDLWLAITLGNISSMVNSGASLNLKDYNGNTVLNFCYTYEIYDRLRCLGADFQLSVWMYFNPVKTVVGSAALIGAIAVVVGAVAQQ